MAPCSPSPQAVNIFQTSLVLRSFSTCAAPSPSEDGRMAMAAACNLAKKCAALRGWAAQAQARRDTSSGTNSVNILSAQANPFSNRSVASEFPPDFTSEAADQHVRARDDAENSSMRSMFDIKMVDTNRGSTGSISWSNAQAPAHSSNFLKDTFGWCKTACTCHTSRSTSPPSCKACKDRDRKGKRRCCCAGVACGGWCSSAMKLFNAKSASRFSGFLSWPRDVAMSGGRCLKCTGSDRSCLSSDSESSSASHFLYHLSIGAILRKLQPLAQKNDPEKLARRFVGWLTRGFKLKTHLAENNSYTWSLSTSSWNGQSYIKW